MAKESRFTVTFAADGAAVTIMAGAHPPEVLTLAAMPADAKEHCFRFGFATYTRNAVAGADKAGWTDAQCHGFMRRKAAAMIAGQFKVSDGAADFHDMVTVALAEKGLPDDKRSAMEMAMLKKDTVWRDAFRSRYKLPIAKARTARLELELVGMAPGSSDLLADLD